MARALRFAKCAPSQPNSEFIQLKEQLVAQEAQRLKEREEKEVRQQVDELSEHRVPPLPASSSSASVRAARQSTLNFEETNEMLCDQAISEFFLGCNIPDSVVESPHFKKMVRAMKCAPADYQPPNRSRMGNDLLLSTTQRLHDAQQPLKQSLLNHCGTVMSDGWDDVECNHLINFLVGTAKGMFFEGTVELKASEHEDADTVAKLILACVEREGDTNIVQVCTERTYDAVVHAYQVHVDLLVYRS